MQLYQLAMELDERSPDVADRAEALGLGTVGPTSDLTPEQVSTLRAAYRKPDPGPRDGPVTRIGPPEPEPDEPAAASRGRSGRGRTLAIVAACILGFAGVVGFFVSQGSADEQRRADISKDLEAWEKAPPATVAPEVEAAVTFPGDQPRDRAKLCAAFATAFQREHDAPATDATTLEWDAYRAWSRDRGAWIDAMNQMIATGPTDAVPAVTAYRDVRGRYYAMAAQGSDAELRALAEGVELDEFEGYQEDIDRARKAMNEYLTPICGNPGG